MLNSIPKQLYKYRAFNVNTLRMITEAEIYYADPTTFNDPLDSKPTIQIDTDLKSLEVLFYKLHIQAFGKEKAKEKIRHHRYMSTQFGNYKVDSEAETYYIQRLASEIKELIYKEFNKNGVFSLAERWDCPLMWSHYADQHRGLCIEYDMPKHNYKNIQQVKYCKPRCIKISDLIKWKIKQSKSAEQLITNTFFFTKAQDWRYEREWRDINNGSGTTSTQAEISAIYFGLRCDTSVRTTIVKLLYSRQNVHPLNFYEIRPSEETFCLKKVSVDTCEIEAVGIRSSDSRMLEGFSDLTIDQNNSDIP